MAKEMDHIPDGWHEIAMHTVNGKAVYLVEEGPAPETISGEGEEIAAAQAAPTGR